MKVGLTQRILYNKGRSYDAIEHAWYKFLSEHSIQVIPNTLDQDFLKLADTLDCLIVTGGDDSKLRRSVELKIAAIMMQNYKPILGICHGAFLITDVLGGTVVPVTGHVDCSHEVTYNDKRIVVNSYHNLGIRNCHSMANTVAWDSEGNTEAWVDGNMAGIVWHPERMIDPFIPAEILKVMKL